MAKIDWAQRPPTHQHGALYQFLLDNDPRPVPEILRVQSPLPDGSVNVPAERYVSKAFHDLEVEKVWKRVWQMACREEEIPRVGDTMIYEISHLKFIIVRSSERRIQAFVNVCRHRGRQLVDFDGCKTEFRCPFHGFTWNLDGSLKRVPSAWDFPQIKDPGEWGLREVKTGTWGGFVFINPDLNCGPLATFLEGLDPHFARAPLEERYITGHVIKVLPTNWKNAQEAFLESWHVPATHPQLLAQSGSPDSQYDIFGNFGRTISPSQVANTVINWLPTEQEMLNTLFDTDIDGPPPIVLDQGESARARVANVSREALRKVVGDVADRYCDSELVDSVFFNVFPNFHPWAGFIRYCYRFRPYGGDPDRSLMDVYLLAPFSGERPPAVKPTILREDQDWTQGRELGVFLGRVLNQDVANMRAMQDSFKALEKDTLTFAHYQESRIRHFHKLLDEWIARK